MQLQPLLLLCLSVLIGCATGDPVDRRPEPDIDEIARALRCGPGKMPFCVDADCGPADYYCADKQRALEMLGPDIKQ